MTEDGGARWSERQRRMLATMGLRLWGREVDAAVAPALPSAAAHGAVVQPAARAAVSGRTGHAMQVTRVEEAAATEQVGWPLLRAAIADCTRCRLHEGRTQAVFGNGAMNPDWLIVGDPPSADEDAAGQPFVGAAGLLLDRMLGALQFSRIATATATDAATALAAPVGRVYTTLALRCRPANGVVPGMAEWNACEGHLQQQIAWLRPKVVLVLGRIAAQALLRSEAPIGQLRGQVHRYQGLPLVVSFHPSYLLRHPDLKGRAWEDWCHAASLAGA